MPQVSRHADLCFTNHTCTPIVGVQATQFTVFANATPVLKLGDPVMPHTIKKGLVCKAHEANVNMGSTSIFVQGIPLARVSDSTDFGFMIQGAPNVFAGG